MDIQIESLHFEATDELQKYVIEKTEKLEHFYDRIENCRVVLKVDHSEKRANKIVEIIMNLQQKNRLFAKDQDETFELAVVRCIDEIKRQLIKYKELKAKHHDANPDKIIEG